MNNYFQFKKFVVQQENCAMKVCTDSCLFGAWVAKYLQTKNIISNKILDIGCGTGLLSMMIAQKNTATIDAIEIDEQAYLQATENITQSIFSTQIKVHHTAIQTFKAKNKYDFIICNPPFYEQQLKANMLSKNMAMHDDTLTFEELLLCIKKLLHKNGSFALLIPYDRLSFLEKKLFANHFFIQYQANIKQTPIHNYFRTMLIINNFTTENNITALTIKDTKNQYSKAFSDLLSGYYLAL